MPQQRTQRIVGGVVVYDEVQTLPDRAVPGTTTPETPAPPVVVPGDTGAKWQITVDPDGHLITTEV